MNYACIDANVILRLITNDPPDQADQAEQLFAAVDKGDITLFVADIIVAEVVWVLKSFYRYEPVEITILLSDFLDHDGLKCEDKASLLLALNLYKEKKIDFIDALLAAQMVKLKIFDIYSFDTHFDRLTGIKRLKPGQ